MERMTMIELYDAMGNCVRELTKCETAPEELEMAMQRSTKVANLAKRMITDANSMINAKRIVGSLTRESVDNLVGNF